MINNQRDATGFPIDDKWIKACVLATGVTITTGVPLGMLHKFSYVRDLPEHVWILGLEQPMEWQDHSTAPKPVREQAVMCPTDQFATEWHADDDSRLSRYSDLANTDPTLAVRAMIYDVDRNLLRSSSATDWLFARLVSSRSIEDSPYYDALRSLASAQRVAEIAVRQYQEYGNERRLAVAASLLRDYGSRAWPALNWISQSGLSDCEYFVDLVVGIPRVAINDRVQALARLAEAGNADVRWGIFGALEDDPGLRAPQLLGALSSFGDPELVEAMSQMRGPSA